MRLNMQGRCCSASVLGIAAATVALTGWTATANDGGLQPLPRVPGRPMPAAPVTRDSQVVPAGIGCRDGRCRDGRCGHAHLAGCRHGHCAPHCPVRPEYFGYYGTRWRRWPGSGVVQVSAESVATPVPPARLAVPSADEESPAAAMPKSLLPDDDEGEAPAADRPGTAAPASLPEGGADRRGDEARGSAGVSRPEMILPSSPTDESAIDVIAPEAPAASRDTPAADGVRPVTHAALLQPSRLESPGPAVAPPQPAGWRRFVLPRVNPTPVAGGSPATAPR